MIRMPPDMVSGKKTSWLAIAAVGCAIAAIIIVLFDLFVGFFDIYGSFRYLTEEGSVIPIILFSHMAFILAIIAIVVIAFSHKKLKGEWYAVAAIFLSLPFIFATVSGIFVNRNRAEGKKTTNGQIISLAIVEYAKDHNGYLPDTNQWCDLLVEYDKKLSKDKFKYDSSKEGICNYAFNRNLSGAQLDNMSYNTVLVFESEGKWNLSGTEELLKKTPKKRRYVYVYTKDTDAGNYFLPRAINVKDADYECVLWKLSYRKQ